MLLSVPAFLLLGNAKTAGRLMLGMTGQAIISVFNFVVSIILIRTFTAEEYGIYALATAVFAGLGVAVDGALVCGPLTVYGTRRVGRPSRAAVESLLSSVHLLIIVAILPITIALAALIVARSFVLDLAFGLYVAAFVSRNYSRSFAFARQRPGVVLAGDVALVCLALAPIALQLLLTNSLSLLFVLHALAVSYALAMCLDLRLLRLSPRITLRQRSLSRYQSIWRQVRWALIGSTSTLAQCQAHSVVVSTFSSPTTFAPLAAGQVLFGPLRILVTVWHSIMQPELVIAISRNDHRAVVRTLEMSMLALGAVVLGLGVAILVFWDVVFTHLYAAKYADAPMLGIVAICFAITLCATLAAPASGVLQTLLQYRVLSLGTVYGSTISLITAVILLLSLGPTWSLLGILAGEAFALFYNIALVARMLNRWRDGHLAGLRRAEASQ